MRYASIRSMDISNGEGIGVALFVQGCPFHCHNCFNSETWDFNGGKEWTEEAKEQFLKLADRPYINRISILGGEPLAKQNLEEVLSLIKEIRLLFPEKNIWLYTGYNFDLLQKEFNVYEYTPFAAGADEWLIRSEIISYVNILVDGTYVDELKDVSLKWRGSSNQRVIDIKRTMKNGNIVLYEN